MRVTAVCLDGVFLPGGGYAMGGKAVLRHSDGVFTFIDGGNDVTDGVRAARGGRNAEEIRATGPGGLCFNSPGEPTGTQKILAKDSGTFLLQGIQRELEE